jgi:Ca2+-binding RTX toxin-like protein
MVFMVLFNAFSPKEHSMAIQAKNTLATGVCYTLNGQQDLIVGRNITLQSVEEEAVVLAGTAHRLTIAGKLYADEEVIYASTTLNRFDLTLAATASLVTQSSAVDISAAKINVINRGEIIAEIAMQLYGTGERINVLNAGRIFASYAALDIGDNRNSLFRNTGQILVPDSYIYDCGDGRDVFVNEGRAVGEVYFSGGNDLYDGRKGRLFGDVSGGEGKDIFRPGRGSEVLDGGNGIDTLDYRSGQAVKIHLDNAQLASGAARGDVAENFEIVLGSATGNDTIHGFDGAEKLVGNGGNDRLFGGLGNDSLIGGKGADYLKSGEGVDLIVGGLGADQIDLRNSPAGWTFVQYDGLADCGDRIRGFSQSDEIVLKGSAFGGGLAPEEWAFDNARFHSGSTNKAADNGDRIIFRTTDATLWFDRDGAKAAFKPVMIADLDDGTAFFAYNITII